MQSAHRTRRRRSLIALGAIVLFLGSSLPGVPSLGTARSSNHGLMAAGPLNHRMVEVPANAAPLAGSLTIIGRVGGTLSVGRFTVSVPPGALMGTAQISIQVPDPTRMACRLNISPSWANSFKGQVGLACDVSGGNFADEGDLIWAWYDARSLKWQPITASTVNPVNHTVYAPLSRFSDYGVYEGKGGW